MNPLSARLEIELGDSTLDYADIMDSVREYKRSRVSASGKNGTVTIAVEADDPRALLASLNGMLKQLRIISSVGAAIKIDKAHGKKTGK